MPIKILLADKSITIQKVVEMLFSGKDYEVVCVSDGETALAEASRVAPDVVLADIDLPRVDGYSFSGRLKQVPALAQIPVILMMSRDDVFDQGKAQSVSIVDHIAKPFESQELISKIKKAVGASPRTAAAAAAAPQRPVPAKPAAALPQQSTPKPKQAPPTDIFDIIKEAPGQADPKSSGAEPLEEDGIYEVEPVVEVDEGISRELAGALPTGEKAVEEMREGLGLAGNGKKQDKDIISFETLEPEAVAPVAREYVPPRRQEPEPVAREWKPPVSSPPPAGTPAPSHQAAISESDIWSMAEGIVAKVAKEMIGNMEPPKAAARTAGPGNALREVDDDSASKIVREMAREVIEKVAWEVVPDLAAAMIRAEIERLKAEP